MSNDASASGETMVTGTRMLRRPLTVAVEGNIGSGKSTFLEYCRERSDCVVYPEPVEQWRNVNGTNLLSEFYANPRRWALAFQLCVGESMLDIYSRKTWKNIKIVERSLLSSRHCFMESMSRSGILDGTSAHILDQWYERSTDYKATPHCIVYIRTSPVVAYNRMNQRARNEESAVSMAYITELHELHEDWLTRLQATNVAGGADIPILTINADVPVLQLISRYESCIEDLHLLPL